MRRQCKRSTMNVLPKQLAQQPNCQEPGPQVPRRPAMQQPSLLGRGQFSNAIEVHRNRLFETLAHFRERSSLNSNIEIDAHREPIGAAAFGHAMKRDVRHARASSAIRGANCGERPNSTLIWHRDAPLHRGPETGFSDSCDPAAPRPTRNPELLDAAAAASVTRAHTASCRPAP